jgi:hypothetical protein
MTNQQINSSGVQHPNLATLEGATRAYQKPDFKSTFAQHMYRPTLFTISRMWGMGKLLRLVCMFKARKSMTRRSLSLLGLATGKQGEAQGVCIFLAKPQALTAVNSSRTNLEWAGERRMGAL